MTTKTDTTTIRILNDVLRKTFLTGQVFLTPGVAGASEEQRTEVIQKVQTFEAFTPDNDPHGEHDFGAFEALGAKYFWKIDYYAPDMEHGSEDPTDPSKTTRVLTIMRADEY